MIKAIIFDYGNVIAKFDNNKIIRGLSRHSEKTESELETIIYKKSGLPKKYESGAISSDEFYNQICSLCGINNMSKEEFIKVYTDKFSQIKETIKLIRELKPNYKLGLLSNTSELDFRHGFEPTPSQLSKMFDAITLSYEVKTMKPDPKIFLDMLKKLDLQPENCVYIDDIREYVAAAQNIGMYGIVYKSNQQLVEGLKKLDVKIKLRLN